MHLGVPAAQHPATDDNNREAAVRSIGDIHAMADAVGVKVALEVMGNSLSTAPDLVELTRVRAVEGAWVGESQLGAVDEWPVPPALVGLFGSAARRDGVAHRNLRTVRRQDPETAVAFQTN